MEIVRVIKSYIYLYRVKKKGGKNKNLKLKYSAVQSIMHDWNDEDCVKILKNCRKAIPEKSGKVIIMDIVLHPSDQLGLAFDLLMMAHSSGGKERTELEWKKLLEDGGFPRYNIIKIPSFLSIIEAYPM